MQFIHYLKEQLHRFVCFFLGFSTLFSFLGFSKSCLAEESGMQSVFTDGGYGALFGAMMGAAILPFTHKSASENFRIIAGGASIGFMTGSGYAFYSINKSSRSDSFFNSTTQNDPEMDYPSLPPTQSNLNSKSKTNLVQHKNTRAKVGALLMGSNKDMYLAIPRIGIGENAVAIELANIQL